MPRKAPSKPARHKPKSAFSAFEPEILTLILKPKLHALIAGGVKNRTDLHAQFRREHNCRVSPSTFNTWLSTLGIVFRQQVVVEQTSPSQHPDIPGQHSLPFARQTARTEQRTHFIPSPPPEDLALPPGIQERTAAGHHDNDQPPPSDAPSVGSPMGVSTFGSHDAPLPGGRI